MKISLVQVTAAMVAVAFASTPRAAAIAIDRDAALAQKHSAGKTPYTAQHFHAHSAPPRLSVTREAEESLEPIIPSALSVSANETEEDASKEPGGNDALIPRAGIGSVIGKMGEGLTHSADGGSNEAVQCSSQLNGFLERLPVSQLDSTPLSYTREVPSSTHVEAQAAGSVVAAAASSRPKVVEHENQLHPLLQKYRYRTIPPEDKKEVERLRKLHRMETIARTKREQRKAMTQEERLTQSRVDTIKSKAQRSGKITENDAVLLKSLPGAQLKLLQQRYPNLIISGRSEYRLPARAIPQSRSPRAQSLHTEPDSKFPEIASETAGGRPNSNVGLAALPSQEVVALWQRPQLHGAKSMVSPGTSIHQQSIEIRRSQASSSSSRADVGLQQETNAYEHSIGRTIHPSISSPHNVVIESHSSTGSRYATPSPDFEAMFDVIEDEHMFDGFEVFHKAHSGSAATTPSRSPSSVKQQHSAAISSSSQHGAVHPAVAPGHEASPDTPSNHDYYQWMEKQSLF